jgi:hypothetical protein
MKSVTRARLWCCGGKDQVYLEIDEFSRQGGQGFETTFRGAVLDYNILAVAPA